jgi:hypothetical protein
MIDREIIQNAATNLQDRANQLDERLAQSRMSRNRLAGADERMLREVARHLNEIARNLQDVAPRVGSQSPADVVRATMRSFGRQMWVDDVAAYLGWRVSEVLGAGKAAGLLAGMYLEVPTT